jgi:hypothetical protein
MPHSNPTAAGVQWMRKSPKMDLPVHKAFVGFPRQPSWQRGFNGGGSK